MPEVVTIETPSLGDRSYLIHDGADAVVVDPQRDIERVLAFAESRRVRISHVLETHIHNDYVTGGLALARHTGAEYVVAVSEEVGFSRLGVGDNDQFGAGALTVKALHTPGHTPGHMSFVLGEVGQGPFAVFTGGSLLFGAVGRTDLIGPGLTEQLTRAQYRSVRRLAAELPEEVAVYPTHGFGSFCSATQSAATSSSLGRERQVNPVLRLDEGQYVRELLAGLDAFPAYYAHMGPANAAGPAGPDLAPPRRADATELRRRIEAGEWVVDLRARRAFAAGHVAGTLSFDLDGAFATYLGWLIPWGTPLTLLGRTPEQVAEAQRELVRIGIDRIAAAAAGHPADWSDGRALRSYPVADFADLVAVRHHRPVVILDVRRDQEWNASHMTGAVHIPIHQLPSRLADVPEGEVWVHCEAGYRASVAASFLDAAGRSVVAVDDEFHRAVGAGLPIDGLRPQLAAQ